MQARFNTHLSPLVLSALFIATSGIVFADTANINQINASGSDNNFAAITQDSNLGGINASITQDGSGNQVGGLALPSGIYQHASQNVSADVSQYGNHNFATLVQDHATNSSISLLQTTNNNTALISQTGNNNTATVTQEVYDGHKLNLVQTGNNNTTVIDQNGTNDEINLTVTGDTNTYLGSQTLLGSLNLKNIDQPGIDNFAYTDQYGNDGTINLYQPGNHNTFYGYQGGNFNTQDISQTGDYNYAYAQQDGDYNYLYLLQSGSNNYANTYQNGSYNSAYLYQTGSGNTLTTYQDGIGLSDSPNVVTAWQTSNNNLASLSQTGGAGNGISLTQAGAGSHSAAASQTGNNNIAVIYQH